MALFPTTSGLQFAVCELFHLEASAEPSVQLCTFVGPSLLHFYCIMVGWYLLHLLLWSELDADFSITVMIFSSKLEIVTNPNSVHLPGFAVSLHGHHSAVVFSYLDWLAFS
jgi:hypothetical protein